MRAVAGAHELVLRLVPGDDASQVGAHRHDPVVLDLLLVRHHQVGRVTLREKRGRELEQGGGVEHVRIYVVVSKSPPGRLRPVMSHEKHHQ